jgi:malate dehydrogenase
MTECSHHSNQLDADRALVPGPSIERLAVPVAWSLVHPTLASDWHSIAVCSDGSYEVEKGLISSFSIRTVGDAWEILQNALE